MNNDYLLEMLEDSFARNKQLSEDNIHLIAQMNVFAGRIAILEKENTELRERLNGETSN